MLQNPHIFLTFDKVHNPLRLPRETTSERPKVVRTPCAFNILTSKCARATTACTFSTSESELPKVVREWCVLCILTWKCASRHNGVHFFDISTSNSAPNLVLHILTSKCASRHNGVQLFISHLARWLRTRRFSESTFRPSGATNHWKTRCFVTFLPFRAPASSFF